MAPPSSSCSSPHSSSASSKSLPALHTSPAFDPIQECEEEGEENGECNDREFVRHVMLTMTPRHRSPTMVHRHGEVPSAPDPREGGGTSVLCSSCRPHAWDKVSTVPLDNFNHRQSSSAAPSPNGILKSIVSTLTGKSPRLDGSSPSTSAVTAREERWKVVFAELSHKLVKATRRRDEAISEAVRLKCSISELEKKLDRLESYCRNLNNDLERHSANPMPPHSIPVQIPTWFSVGNNDNEVVERFLVAVADARSTVRILSRSLTVQLRSSGGGAKVYDKLLVQLKPFEIKAAALTGNPRGLACYLEALLNKAFFEDFESTGFQKTGATHVLNPADRCMANLEQFMLLNGLTWEKVLSKGTKHFNEEFSRFCDRKMSEIILSLGCNRAWPEPMLQAFFGASKSVWVVHLLANSVHPAFPIFRVETGSRFDPVYMEDMNAGKSKRLVPSYVRAMVVPGFYVYGSVVKCKVLCRYQPAGGAVPDADADGVVHGEIKGSCASSLHAPSP
ncbi:hypothetical protein MLD38_010920 [Melastoma candidum]|uniref:Uncharacterized protein n=1 Tax=Melastoma candidum TaxID=119954 RepID=A0ACB9R0W6_9MYRT|nr:hypothetical protein MLD38_010920 [Melastoma candidum]